MIAPANLKKLQKMLTIIVACLFSLMLLLVGLLSWVTFTETGTRQLFVLLARQEVLSYQSLQGSIRDGLRIETLTVKAPNAHIGITDLILKVQWNELFYSNLQIVELSAQSVNVELKADAKSSPENKPFNLSLLRSQPDFVPFNLLLHKLSIHHLSINNKGQLIDFKDIYISSKINQQGINATSANLAYKKTRIQLEGSVRVAPELAINMTVNWTSLLSDGTAITGDALLTGDAGQLKIKHHSQGNLVSDAEIQVSDWLDQPFFSIQASAASLSWPLTSKTAPQLSDIVLAANGSLSSLQTSIKGQIELGERGKMAFDLATDISRTQLDITSLRLTGADTGSAEFSGQLSWPGGVPRWQGVVTLNQFDARFIQPLLPEKLVGHLNLNGQFDQALQLSIISTKLQGMIRELLFEAQIRAEVDGDTLRIEQLQASVGDNQLDLSGNLDKTTIDIIFESQITDLNEIIPNTKGTLQSNGRLSGSPEQPTIKALLKAKNMDAYGVSASSLELTLDMFDGQFIHNDNQFIAEHLHYHALSIDKLNLTAQGTWLRPRLTLQALTSRAQLITQTDLRIEKSGMTGQLNKLHLTEHEHGAKSRVIDTWQLESPVSYSLAAQTWSMTPLCLKESIGRACLQATTTGSALKATLEIRQLPASLFNSSDLLPTSISGLLDIDANVAGDAAHHQGQLRITQSHKDSPLILTVDDEAETQISIADLTFETNLKNGSLTGRFDAKLNETGLLTSQFEIRDLLTEYSPLAAQIDYRIPDLQPYAILLPEVDALSGQLEGTIKFGHSLQQPALSLYTRLTVPHIYIKPLAIEWTDLTAEISTLSESKQQLKASLKAGDGVLDLSGTLTFLSTKNWLSELHIKGQNALLIKQPNRRIVASPDLHIIATPDALDVKGLLLIPEASLVHKSSPNRLTLTSDAVIHNGKTEKPQRAVPYRFNLKLDVIAGDKVHFEAYGLKTDVAGKLTLSKQSPAGLLGHGELNLVNGAFQAYGQDLTIERGIIRFSGLLNRPEINLTANRTVKNVKAGLRVNGPVDNLQTKLYSEPSLPDSEILSYIIRGRPLRDANAADQNALANALLSYSISQSSPVTSKLTALSGLDEIGLEAEEGIETLGFALGKYITPRLYARYGIGVIDKLSKVFLQYQLTDRLYLETESGQGQSVDLMYRSR